MHVFNLIGYDDKLRVCEEMNVILDSVHTLRMGLRTSWQQRIKIRVKTQTEKGNMTQTSIRLENELELKKRFQRLRGGAAAAMDG